MYWSEIVWFFSWPVVIIISYMAIRFALAKFEKNQVDPR